MSTKINNILPDQNLTLVRDQIGVILTEELESQATLRVNNPDAPGNDVWAKPTVWLERYVGFQKEELPAIIVTLDDGIYSNQDVRKTTGEYGFFIDVYCDGEGTDTEDGYLRSSKLLHMLMGNVWRILMCPAYSQLDLPKEVVNRRTFRDFFVVEKEVNVRNKGILLNDLESNTIGRMRFMVTCTEYTDTGAGVPLQESKVKIVLDENGKGITFKYIAD